MCRQHDDDDEDDDVRMILQQHGDTSLVNEYWEVHTGHGKAYEYNDLVGIVHGGEGDTRPIFSDVEEEVGGSQHYPMVA